MKTAKNITTLFAPAAACLFLRGCAATQIALEHKDLKLQTQVS